LGLTLQKADYQGGGSGAARLDIYFAPNAELRRGDLPRVRKRCPSTESLTRTAAYGGVDHFESNRWTLPAENLVLVRGVPQVAA
jgi:hypothetical protein